MEENKNNYKKPLISKIINFSSNIYILKISSDFYFFTKEGKLPPNLYSKISEIINKDLIGYFFGFAIMYVIAFIIASIIEGLYIGNKKMDLHLHIKSTILYNFILILIYYLIIEFVKTL